MDQETIDLAVEIADGSARADIETMCEEIEGLPDARPRWWDTTMVDEPDKVYVDLALRYLDKRGMLERRSDAAHIVAFKESA